MSDRMAIYARLAAMIPPLPSEQVIGNRSRLYSVGFIGKLHRLLQLHDGLPWISNCHIDPHSGTPSYSITLLLASGHTFRITVSIERPENRCQLSDKLPWPHFEPSVCDVHLLSPDGEIYCNRSIGYPNGNALFRGDLSSLALQLVGEALRLNNIMPEQVVDDPPPYNAMEQQ